LPSIYSVEVIGYGGGSGEEEEEEEENKDQAALQDEASES
jgi:hypothetical protein